MSSLVIYLPRRGVRTMVASHFKTPWAFLWKSKGVQSIGPFYKEEWAWPKVQSGCHDLRPLQHGPNHEKLQDFYGCQSTAYIDSENNQSEPPEMIPRLVVPPDLKTFQLKPYVSFRCAEDKIHESPMTAEKLFNNYYKKDIERAFKDGKYKENETVLTNDRHKIIKQLGIPTLADVNYDEETENKKDSISS